MYVFNVNVKLKHATGCACTVHGVHTAETKA